MLLNIFLSLQFIDKVRPGVTKLKNIATAPQGGVMTALKLIPHKRDVIFWLAGVSE